MALREESSLDFFPLFLGFELERVPVKSLLYGITSKMSKMKVKMAAKKCFVIIPVCIANCNYSPDSRLRVLKQM